MFTHRDFSISTIFRHTPRTRTANARIDLSTKLPESGPNSGHPQNARWRRKTDLTGESYRKTDLTGLRQLGPNSALGSCDSVSLILVSGQNQLLGPKTGRRAPTGSPLSTGTARDRSVFRRPRTELGPLSGINLS